MKLLILTLEEKETIQLRKDDTLHYRTYGDASIYMLPPCIVLGEDGDYDQKVEIPKHFTLLRGTIRANRFCSYIPLEEMDEIHRIQEELKLQRMDTGLFTSLEDGCSIYSTSLYTIRIKNLELVELGDNTSRTVRRRPLKRY